MNLEESFELEIGFGNSCILFRLAELFPKKQYFGIELEQGCFTYETQLKKYPNVKLIRGDARNLILNFPLDFFDRIHIYFPSPFPKQKRYIDYNFLFSLS